MGMAHINRTKSHNGRDVRGSLIQYIPGHPFPPVTIWCPTAIENHQTPSKSNILRRKPIVKQNTGLMPEIRTGKGAVETDSPKMLDFPP